jgi:hypothetical protein
MCRKCFWRFDVETLNWVDLLCSSTMLCNSRRKLETRKEKVKGDFESDLDAQMLGESIRPI